MAAALATYNLRFSCVTTGILVVLRVADRWQHDAGMQHDGAVVV
jgi:hypothetical protein